MARNNAKFFVDDDYFVSLNTSGTANNIIVIDGLEFSKPSNGEADNPVYCSFRGEPLKQVLQSELDVAENENCFAYVTIGRENQIHIAVSKTEVDDVESALKYIRGMLVDYQLMQLTKAGSYKDALYEVCTYLSDGTLVSPTIACNIGDVVRKIQALEANLDVNEAGYYKHIVRATLAPKG